MVSSDSWPSGTVTFLFTDVVGSTQRWRADEVAMAAAMQAHDDTLRSAVAEAGGVVFKHTGDGVIAAFSSPRTGLNAALGAQEQLALPVRMGLHTGEAELRDGDYFGTTLNRAARVMDAGHGGQVLLSAATAPLLDGDVELVDLGLFELKGLEAAERVFQAGNGSFPDLRARRAEVGNLPRELTGFVGRETELGLVATELAAGPIVTLFGVGGTGKTRLAVEAARSVAQSFADGCWMVELGQVTLPEAVPFAMSTGVGMATPDSGDVTEALVRRLVDREMLILVDNCEHVVDAAAEVIERIASACPRVRMVATSREPLMVRGERVVPIGPLPEDDGFRLFLERARAESPNLVLDNRQRDAVATLCRRIDGLPLAIELAAARVRSMTPVDLVAGLDERFRLLVGSRRSRTERHQTMRATLDWSYSLCDTEEQVAFDRLAVFPASFDAAAAGAVAGGDDLSPVAVQDALARLVDRSLLTSEVGDDGTTQFRMLETMRVYGREHLRDMGQSDAVRERHAHHLADEVDRLTAALLGLDEQILLQRLDGLIADAVLAVDWFVENDELDQAMRFPSAMVIIRQREANAMIELIRQAARSGIGSDELRAELDLTTPSIRSSLTDSEVIERLRLLSPRPDRDTAAGLADRTELSDDLAAEALLWVERFRSARPLSRYISLFFCSRQFINAGRMDDGLGLLDEFAAFAESTPSEIARTGLLDLEAKIARREADWARAAMLLDELVERRSGLLQLSNFAMLSRFSAIAAHTLAGDAIPVTRVRDAWDALQRHGNVNPSWSAASATAIWLDARGHRDLAIRFLRWAGRLEDFNALALYADELGLVDLPIDPDGPDEQLGPLIDELDFV
jgi:predicted ATPase/class 3 adenylate cyclase